MTPDTKPTPPDQTAATLRVISEIQHAGGSAETLMPQPTQTQEHQVPPPQQPAQNQG